MNVVIGADIDAFYFLDTSLKAQFAKGDVDGVMQTINLVSTVVGEKNCTLAPDCTALNRDDCLVTINTCSSCLTGFKGIVGDSNTKCISESSSIGTIGSDCTSDDDCLYQHCHNGMCSSNPQTCQSSVPGAICSGHGTCRNLDSSGNSVQNCTSTDSFCSPSCLCRDGYGGVDCSFTPDSLRDRSKVRSSMCAALTRVISTSEKSSKLFDTIASTLLSAYDKDEISGAAGLLQCSSVIRFLGTLASKGFLKGTLPETQQIYAEISSQFLATTSLSSASTGASTFEKDVISAVKGLTTGILKGMVEGQIPVNVVTSNIRATMISQLVSSLTDAHFSPPPTVAESAYGSLLPKIVLPGDGISLCSNGANYAQITTLQYGNNPHSNSETIRSPLLHFASTTTKKSARKGKSRSRALLQSSNSSAENSRVPAYYIVMQFSTEQRFNQSIQAGSDSKSSNVSLPECTLYDAALAQYVSCDSCNVSSYTDFNVTFGCYEIGNLCPSSVKVNRRLENAEDEDRSQGELSHKDEDEEDDEIEEDDENGGESKVGRFATLSNRELDLQVQSASGSNDDYATNDDAPSGSDDRFVSKKTTSVNEFGTILTAIGDQLSSVLSQNPFLIDLSKATPVLAFVGTLFGLIIIGMIFFLRWDKTERHDAIYLFDSKEREIRNQIVEDLKRGGNGVSSEISEIKKVEKKKAIVNVFSASMVSIHSNSAKKDPLSKVCDIVDDETVCSDDGTGHNVLEATILIAQFSNQVLPRTYTVDDKLLELKKGRYRFNISLWLEAFYTIRRTHYLTAMFYRSSACLSRTLQFCETVRKVLLFLFIDTVIYGVFFPSDTTCTVYLKKATCTALPSKVRMSSWIE